MPSEVGLGLFGGLQRSNYCLLVYIVTRYSVQERKSSHITTRECPRSEGLRIYTRRSLANLHLLNVR